VEGIRHPGFAFIQTMSPCPTFYNTFDLWRGRTEELPADHDPSDRMQAMAQAYRDDAIPLGVFYRAVRPTLDSHTCVTNHPLKEDWYDFDVRSLLKIYR
jgi:2-oxoglutarate ferredoxin oxidoreductase subunit beta